MVASSSKLDQIQNWQHSYVVMVASSSKIKSNSTGSTVMLWWLQIVLKVDQIQNWQHSYVVMVASSAKIRSNSTGSTVML